MYNCKLKIYLVNCNEMNETIENIQPLEKFSHDFYTIDTLEGINEVDVNTLIILNSDSKVDKTKIQKYKNAKATLVLLIKNSLSEMESVLNLFDYIMNGELNPPLMRHHFKKILTDIKLKKELWLYKNYLNELMNSIPDLVWFKRKDGVHLKVNDAFCEAVNKPRDDIEGYEHAHIWGLTQEQIDSGAYDCNESEEAVMKAGKTLTFNEEVLHSKRGMIQLGVYKSPIKDEYGEPIGTVGVAQDITKLMEQQAALKKMAQTDDLTQLTNGKYFYEYVTENRDENKLTLCFMDLDNLKAVNDNYGYSYGDLALTGIADILKMAFPDELVSRMGGDEFLVTIIGDYKHEDLIARLKFVKEKSAEFFSKHKAFEHLMISIGIASTTDRKVLPEKLLMMSDKALVYCKAHNRGEYTFYDDVVNSK